jgi:hypothetical protein
VIDQFEVSLPRPRSREVLTSPEFTRLKKRAFDQLFEERQPRAQRRDAEEAALADAPPPTPLTAQQSLFGG